MGTLPTGMREAIDPAELKAKELEKRQCSQFPSSLCAGLREYRWLWTSVTFWIVV